MTDEDLARIEARALAAPPGHEAEHPDDLPGRSLVVCGRERGPVIDRTVVGVEGPERVAVAELYGHAQEDILALVAEVRRLRAETGQLRARLESLVEECPVCKGRGDGGGLNGSGPCPCCDGRGVVLS